MVRPSTVQQPQHTFWSQNAHDSCGSIHFGLDFARKVSGAPRAAFIIRENPIEQALFGENPKLSKSNFFFPQIEQMTMTHYLPFFLFELACFFLRICYFSELNLLLFGSVKLGHGGPSMCSCVGSKHFRP